MPVDQEKRRARWRRNKADERRRKTAGQQHPPIDPGFERSIWAERDKRLRTFPWNLPRLADGRSHHRRMYEETYDLVCDVWAVETLLMTQRDGAKVSDGKIADWLYGSGKTHDVKLSSLRTKVWRARKVVRYLEEAPARDGNGPFWPKFPESVAEHGSWLAQHVKELFPDFNGF